MKHRPRKQFGQNFLQDLSVVNRILQVINALPDEVVIEIGPGPGALTVPLMQRLESLTAIEIDRDLAAHLIKLPQAAGKLHLINADALTVDYSQFGKSIRMVGNLPYNIATPLLLHLFHYTSCIQDMHFMLQKEVVERLTAMPGSRDYGRLSIITQYHCDAEYLFTVPPAAFYPQPKVESAMVRLTPHTTSPWPPVETGKLEKLTAMAFSMRRKTLANNLKGVINAAGLEQLGIDASLRPEQISIAEYIRITGFLNQTILPS